MHWLFELWLAQKLLQPVPQFIGGELILMSPGVVMGAEFIDPTLPFGPNRIREIFMAKRKGVFNSLALIREMARERIGQPRPTAVLVDKRRIKREREQRREIREMVK